MAAVPFGMEPSKWPDFLFTLAVRLLCGMVLGGLACSLLFWRGLLRAFSHDHVYGPLLLMLLCAGVGGLIAIFTIPSWQTPWYKGIRSRDDDHL